MILRGKNNMKNLILAFLLLININTDVLASFPLLEAESSTSRIVSTQVMCHSFDGGTKNIELKVMDVLQNDVEEIFNELFDINFPI